MLIPRQYSWKGTLRLIALIGVYSAIFLIASCLSLLVRFDFSVELPYWKRWVSTILWLIPLKLVLMGFFAQYRSLLSYFSYPDAKSIVLAQASAATMALLIWFWQHGNGVLPRGSIITDSVISILFLGLLRMGLRRYRERGKEDHHKGHIIRKKVMIIGAGRAGATIAHEIQSKPGLGMMVLCFADDKEELQGQLIHGIAVIGGLKEIPKIAARLEINKAILAMPRAASSVIKETVAMLNELGIEHDILPSIDQILHKKVTINHLRPVNPEDLLGRDAVSLDDEKIRRLLENKVVMVTGAGGSIGSELCRQIALHGPRKLLLAERSEPALFAIEQELLEEDIAPSVIEPLALNICDERRMEAVFTQYQPEIVFHAAAHKHVPLMERQPAEAIINNDLGTMVVALAASRHGAERFVLVSTDKAVNPTNVMGATKRVAEMIIQSIQSSQANGTVFSAVRFGNVLGSSGSVIPTFRKQIAEGGPITVTHPEITRYFMSIPEAVGLILQSATQAKGGEINVLDMGQPIKIRELAKQMIELSGLTPEVDIQIEYSGLRPGEKLYEEPIHEGEDIRTTSHPKIKWIERGANGKDVLAELKALKEDLYSSVNQNGHLKEWLGRMVPEYTPWKE